MIDVKICGLTQPDDMRLCAELDVTWVGFVFYERSPRALSAQQARMLHQTIPTPSSGGPKRVGLFVQPHLNDIAHVIDHVPLDVLQLYTSYDNACAIRKEFNIPVWLARGIRTIDDLPTASEADVDGFIIEAPAEQHDTRPGGLGKSFDWSLTQNWPSPRPWLLAGGLIPDNVRDALTCSRASAVDVSSGVEDAPGHKSAEQLRKFVKNARSWGCSVKKP